MKILNFNQKYIKFSNDTETFTFANLAKTQNNSNLGTNSNHWLLKRYTTTLQDGTAITAVATFNQNATYYSITLGYPHNNTIIKTIRFDEADRTIENDVSQKEPESTPTTSLADEILKSFFTKNQEFSYYLNYFGNYPWKMEELLTNYEDKFTVRNYDYEIQKVLSLKKGD